MNREFKASLPQFALELALYAVLITAYYLCVLHFLGDSLARLYLHHRRTYAGVALTLIVTQGLLLEVLTRLLLEWLVRRRRPE
ncbi:MAG TPA: hypothetical protein VFE51_23660 [Verrucomicrobiae bacterium]|nr:hypothetical protein [Verrucomicrobiae bacterium]